MKKLRIQPILLCVFLLAAGQWQPAAGQVGGLDTEVRSGTALPVGAKPGGIFVINNTSPWQVWLCQTTPACTTSGHWTQVGYLNLPANVMTFDGFGNSSITGKFTANQLGTSGSGPWNQTGNYGSQSVSAAGKFLLGAGLTCLQYSSNGSTLLCVSMLDSFGNVIANANTATKLATLPATGAGAYCTGIDQFGNCIPGTSTYIQLATRTCSSITGLSGQALMCPDSTNGWEVNVNNGGWTQSIHSNLFNNGADTLEEYDGTAVTPQTFNIYRVRTDASNFERMRLGYDAAAGAFIMGAEYLGSGSGRNFCLYWGQYGVSSGCKWWMPASSTPAFYPNGNNTQDLGQAANLIRDFYLGRALYLNGSAGSSGQCAISGGAGVASTWGSCVGSSGMTWPGGGAGIANYNGSSAWGTSYSASNTIPNNFLGTFASGSNGLATGAFATIANYAPLASPGLTGTPTAPTPGSNINTTQIPTTAWVNTYYAPLASPTFTGIVTAPQYCIASSCITSWPSGGSMTWPGGGAGIPNYNGSSGWGTSYSASNAIPGSFLPTITDTLASLAIKPSAGLLATANLTLSGAQTIDGVAGTVGTTLVLATAQSTPSQNGPWVMQTGAWTRPTWFPAGGTTQAFQFIEESIRLGTAYAGSVWKMTSSGAITIDTTSQTWVQQTLAGYQTTSTAQAAYAGHGGCTNQVETADNANAAPTCTTVTSAYVDSSIAPSASPTFTGTPAAPTPGSNINTTQIPTTAWVNTYYAPLASPGLTGTPTAPTATAGDNSTKLATTAYVDAGRTVPLATSFWSTGATSVSFNSVAAKAQLWGFSVSYPLSTTKVTVGVVVADTLSCTYDLGILNASGNIVAHVGNSTATALGFGSTGTKTLTWTGGGGTALPGKYYAAITASGTTGCATLGASTVPTFLANTAETVSSGGTLNNGITIPADVAAFANVPSFYIQ